MRTLTDFVRESNHIEGIPEVREGEVQAAEDFLALEEILIRDLCVFVGVVAPGALLRNRPGMNVRVGSHLPPPGGRSVTQTLSRLLERVNSGTIDPYEAHVRYERIHPFEDGNGRSGRMIWLWQKWQIVPEVPPIGFLHSWYYESLEHYDLRP